MPNSLNWIAGQSFAKSLLCLLALIGGLIALLYNPDAIEALRYQRTSFVDQPWQSITHALVHLNLRHLSLNVLALLCLVALFSEAFRSTGWLLALLGSAAISAAGLYFFSPLTDWCVGLSGALHGLMVYAVLRARASPLWLLALVAKVGLEQTAFYQQSNWLDTTANYIGHDVVVDAHLWGAIGGLIFYMLVHLYRYIAVSIEITRSRG
ncbi:MAG: rhombosortase [Pseudomonadales bacterium]|nr:rhombosortase [Pseudomonadales bacterium]